VDGDGIAQFRQAQKPQPAAQPTTEGGRAKADYVAAGHAERAKTVRLQPDPRCPQTRKLDYYDSCIVWAAIIGSASATDRKARKAARRLLTSSEKRALLISRQSIQ
jgi:hypothetical protein